MEVGPFEPPVVQPAAEIKGFCYAALRAVDQGQITEKLVAVHSLILVLCACPMDYDCSLRGYLAYANAFPPIDYMLVSPQLAKEQKDTNGLRMSL